jgi:hypothetical protein
VYPQAEYAAKLKKRNHFLRHPTSKTVTLGSNGTEEQIARIGDENQHHNKSSHLVRIASAATVNQKVAKAAGLEAQTNEGFAEFLDDLCPCGIKEPQRGGPKVIKSLWPKPSLHDVRGE